MNWSCTCAFCARKLINGNIAFEGDDPCNLKIPPQLHNFLENQGTAPAQGMCDRII